MTIVGYLIASAWSGVSANLSRYMVSLLANQDKSFWGVPAGGQSTISVVESCKEPAVNPQPVTSWLFQMRVLFVRFVRTWYRSPHLLVSFFAQYLFAGVFLGKISIPNRQPFIPHPYNSKIYIHSQYSLEALHEALRMQEKALIGLHLCAVM